MLWTALPLSLIRCKRVSINLTVLPPLLYLQKHKLPCLDPKYAVSKSEFSPWWSFHLLDEMLEKPSERGVSV